MCILHVYIIHIDCVYVHVYLSGCDVGRVKVFISDQFPGLLLQSLHY